MEENKYRYNDISERLRRMNRIYMGATIFMAALILLYLWMKQMNHNIKTVTVYDHIYEGCPENGTEACTV
jgi:methyl-accepting chemotaxis protein